MRHSSHGSRHRRGPQWTAQKRTAVAVVAVAVALVASVSLRVVRSEATHTEMVADVSATITATPTPTDSTTPPAPLPPTARGHAWIGGQPTAGHTWLARTSGWPAGTTFSYQWILDGTPVGSPTTTTNAYVAPAAYFDHKLTVAVTGTNPGHSPTTITMPALRVQGYNPLAGDQWLPPNGPNQWKWNSPEWPNALKSATGGDLAALMKIQNRPRMTWVTAPHGANIAAQIAENATMVRQLIAAQQNGTGHELVQIGIMGIWAIEGGENDQMYRPLSSAEMSTYKQWLTAVAQAIGNTRVAILMEQDLAITTDPIIKGGAQRRQLTAWGTQLLAKNPNATIYLTAGDADWLSPTQAANLLKDSGIQYARGFGLGDTHFSASGDAILHGENIVSALAALGYKNRHFVIDSSDNGKGFSVNQYRARFGVPPYTGNPVICATTSTPSPCVTVGVPETWQVVDNKALNLTPTQRSYAIRNLDAFLWMGGAWWRNSSWPFDKSRAISLVNSSPFL